VAPPLPPAHDPALRGTFPARALAVALALLLPGCLFSGAPDDLFPVCEDRRAQGPSPAYSLDRLADLTDAPGLSPEDERALLGPVRLRVLTMQGASYLSFHANLTPVPDEPGAWRFDARGTGGLSPDWDDAYLLLVKRTGRGVEAEDPRPLRHPVGAPPSLERLALEGLGRTEGLPDLRNRTPTLVASGLDPDLPACVFLSYEEDPAPGAAEPARTEVAVNVVGMRAVHVWRDGW
jgi:hypothetical protein